MDEKINGRLKRNAPMRELAETHEGRFWLWDLLLATALFLVPELVIIFLVNVVLGAYVAVSGNHGIVTALSGGSADATIILGLSLTLPVLIIVLLFWRFAEKKPLSSMGFRKTDYRGKSTVFSYLKGLLLGFLLLFFAWLIAFLSSSADFVFEGVSLSKLPIFLVILVGFLIQGMEEEVVCRGYLMSNLSLRYPVLVGVIVNSCFFAALHLFNQGISVLPVINLVLFGLFASLYFYHTENLWGIGAFHSMWNFTQGNIFGVLVSGTDSGPSLLSTTLFDGRELINGGAFGLEGGLAVTAVYVVAILILVVLIRRKGRENS